MEVLPKRFNRFGLSIHPEKTALIKFRKPGSRDGKGNGNGTFDFLGFTHCWAKSHRGYWVIRRKTRRKAIRRFLKALWIWCRRNRHLPVEVQYHKLCMKVRGHYQYYGISGNYDTINGIYRKAKRYWRYWLSRRSHKGNINWEKFVISILDKFPFPKPRIIHVI